MSLISPENSSGPKFTFNFPDKRSTIDIIKKIYITNKIIGLTIDENIPNGRKDAFNV